MSEPRSDDRRRQEAGRCLVLVPVYRQLGPAAMEVVAHNLAALAHYEACLIGGSDRLALLEETARALSDGTGHEIGIEVFAPEAFSSVPGYSALLISAEFYRRFERFEYILICQDDALILSDGLEEWLDAGWSFVGAPHFAGFGRPERPLRFLGSLNGGLSLRRVPDALAALGCIRFVQRDLASRIAQRSGALALLNMLAPAGRRIEVLRTAINEDMVWSETIPRVVPGFRLPAPEEAARFAFEAEPRHLLDVTGGRLPFACHAFLRYDPDFWRSHLDPPLVKLIDAAALEA